MKVDLETAQYFWKIISMWRHWISITPKIVRVPNGCELIIFSTHFSEYLYSNLILDHYLKYGDKQ